MESLQPDKAVQNKATVEDPVSLHTAETDDIEQTRKRYREARELADKLYCQIQPYKTKRARKGTDVSSDEQRQNGPLETSTNVDKYANMSRDEMLDRYHKLGSLVTRLRYRLQKEEKREQARLRYHKMKMQCGSTNQMAQTSAVS